MTLPIKENPWPSLIAGVNDTADKFVSGVVDTAEQFIAGVVDTADKHSFAIISANFRKKSNWSKGNTQGARVHWFMKKTEVENLVSDKMRTKEYIFGAATKVPRLKT